MNTLSNEATDDYLEINRQVFKDTQISAKKLFEKEGGCLFLVFDNGLNQKAQNNRAWLGGISALAKTAKLELPKAEIKSINIDRSKKSAKKLASEIFHSIISGSNEPEIEIDANGNSYCFISEVAAIEDQSKSLKDGDTLIVSGGAKGVTAACLIALSKRKKINFGILGRTKLEQEDPSLANFKAEEELKAYLFKEAMAQGEKISPIEVNKRLNKILDNREIRKNIQELENRGSQVRYLSVDISNQKDVEKAVAGLRKEFKAIHGFVHAAGVLADKYIHEKSMEQFNRVFDTKMFGLINLLEATKKDKLTHISCFSSVSARIGNVGQADYAMANEILNKVCQREQQRRGETCIVKSMNWGPWDGGMVSPQLKKHFESMGVDLIPLETGAEIFADEMEDRSTENIEIVVGGSFDKWGDQEGPNQDSGSVNLWIHHSNSPFLKDHSIQGNIVVPMMMINEWGMRLAKKVYPNLNIAEIKMMKVYKGINLNNFQGSGDLLSFHYDTQKAEGKTLLNIKVTSESKQPHYGFSLVMTEDINSPEVGATDIGALKAWSYKKEKIYGPVLFHGPEFQVIESLEGISSNGCKGKLKLSNPIFNNHSIWSSEMFLYDGALQIAVAAMEKLTKNNSSLPLGFDSLCVYDYEKLSDHFDCDLVLTKNEDMNSEWDILFKNEKQEVLAKMTGLKLYMYQDN